MSASFWRNGRYVMPSPRVSSMIFFQVASGMMTGLRSICLLRAERAVGVAADNRLDLDVPGLRGQFQVLFNVHLFLFEIFFNQIYATEGGSAMISYELRRGGALLLEPLPVGEKGAALPREILRRVHESRPLRARTSSRASNELSIRGPKKTGSFRTAGSITLCTPVVKLPPTYAIAPER